MALNGLFRAAVNSLKAVMLISNLRYVMENKKERQVGK